MLGNTTKPLASIAVKAGTGTTVREPLLSPSIVYGTNRRGSTSTSNTSAGLVAAYLCVAYYATRSGVDRR